MKRKRQKKWYQLGEHKMYLLSLLLLMAIAVTASCGGGGGGGDGDGGGGGGGGPTGRGSWAPTDTIGADAPSARAAHTQVWTDTEMIVWGGTNDGSTGFDTGVKYDPATDTWTATNTSGAPSARFFARARWISAIGMIVWGGTPDGNTGLNTGGVYDPAADSWETTCDTNVPSPRFRHTTVRNGSNIIVWGGTPDDGATVFNTGGVYDYTGVCAGLGVGSWTATNTTGAPLARYLHSAVRRGGPPETMIVWGGTPDGTNGFNTGGVYDPAGAGSWTPTAIDANTPSARADHRAVMASGIGMIVWGGFDGANGLNTGAIYHPNSNTWSSITTVNAPSARAGHRTVWTGAEMIVWGGTPDYSATLNTGGVYDPATDTWTEMTTTNAPSARAEHRAVWTGTEMIVWGGTSDYLSGINTGGRYTP